MVQTSSKGMMSNASSSEVTGKMQDIFIKVDDKMNVSSNLLTSSITLYARLLKYNTPPLGTAAHRAAGGSRGGHHHSTGREGSTLSTAVVSR